MSDSPSLKNGVIEHPSAVARNHTEIAMLAAESARTVAGDTAREDAGLIVAVAMQEAVNIATEAELRGVKRLYSRFFTDRNLGLRIEI